MVSGNSSFFSRLIREPLLHFLVLGAGLFALYAGVNDGAAERDDRIVVDEEQVMRLAEQFQRTWMRPPTRPELEGLAEDFVKEEILYREALGLGLDRDDLVIRRRMRQKMEFLNADLVEMQSPADADLQAYLDTHPDRFRTAATTSFEQIYLNPARPGPDIDQRAADLLERLNANEATTIEVETLGDPTLLPGKLDAASAREISATFGGQLAEAAWDAPEDIWSGPYASGFGLHLVRVTDRAPARLPVLAEIRTAVEREWSAERRRVANERFYEALRARYTVEVQIPGIGNASPLAAREP
ncbi:MAG: peptidylprolyl isomerase [Pseudomonadota bacterium]|nr:peptidylprolyl isomerase [Pseudomonadota bacterium]